MRYVFGEYELDEHAYELRRTGAPVELERKVYDVLAYLIQHRDRLVTKDELLETLWPGQVVGEAALTTCITSARKALGNDGVRQEFIKTQHGRGYRFVAPVVTVADPVQGSTFQVPCQEEVPSSQEASTNGQRQDVALSPESPLIKAASPVPSRPRRGLALLLSPLFLLGIVVVLEWRLVRSLDSTALPLPDKPSIVVRPFANLSGDPELEYFSDGLTDDLITALARIPGLFVIARHSAFAYKSKAVKEREVSKELGVRYVLTGSVRKTNDHVRLNVHLVDATISEQLWAERFDRPFKDIFALQDEIVQKIVLALKVKLPLQEQGQFRRALTNNLEAYDYYLRGVESLPGVWNEGKKEANARARQMFEKAIELDSQYAAAYAELSQTYLADWFYQWNKDRGQSLERAFELAQQAVALDEALPEPHRVLGIVYVWEKQYEQAISEAERAVALNLNFADGYVTLGVILPFAGQPRKGIEMIEKAMRLNPQYPVEYLHLLGFAYRIAGQYEEAIALQKKVITLVPHFLRAHVNLAACYVELGRLEEAKAEAAIILQIRPDFSLEIAEQNWPYKNPAELERYLSDLRKAGLK